MRTRSAEMEKTGQARYLLEFKQETVRLVTAGQRAAAVTKTLDAAIQTFFNQVKAERQGKQKGVDTKVTSAGQKGPAGCAPSWCA